MSAQWLPVCPDHGRTDCSGSTNGCIKVAELAREYARAVVFLQKTSITRRRLGLDPPPVGDVNQHDLRYARDGSIMVAYCSCLSWITSERVTRRPAVIDWWRHAEGQEDAS